MSECKCGDKESCGDKKVSCKSNGKCKTPCDNCTCNDNPNLDQPHVDGAMIKDIMQGKSPEHLSYCYSNTRAPALWMKKVRTELKRVGVSLKNSKFDDLPRDMNRFLQVYVNNTVLMSQEVTCGMFSILEYADLQKEMLEMLTSFCKNHIMEITRFEVDEKFTFEQIQLLIDCVSGDDFNKSSMILSRQKLYEEKIEKD